jgi:hypothetical protein
MFPFEQGSNPADFIIGVTSCSSKKQQPKGGEEVNAEKLHKIYLDSNFYREFIESEGSKNANLFESGLVQPLDSDMFITPMWNQMRVLCYRRAIIAYKSLAFFFIDWIK